MAPMPTTKAGKTGVIGAGLVLASAAALGLISKWETPAGQTDRYRVYADKLADGLLTSECNGITPHITSTPMRLGDVWDAATCKAETRRAVAKVQTALLKCFQRVPPQSVFDAATSHAWNFGADKTCHSQAMAAWNQGNWTLGCRRLLVGDNGKLQWVYAGGKFYQGLANRRADEMVTCEGLR